MKTNNKPRGDAKLKNLPLGRQAEIAEMLRTRTLDAVREILKAEGLQTSAQALSEFLSWYQRRQAALGTQMADLSQEIHKLNRRDYETERLANQSRAAAAIIKDDDISDAALREQLRRLFKIK
jgi:predicted  nucleic acid-binding Zn-ribbon protein